MARARRRAATRHASSFGAPTVFNEGERNPGAASRVTPRFARMRAQRRSIPVTRASSETTSASGSRSRHLAKRFLPCETRAYLLIILSFQQSALSFQLLLSGARVFPRERAAVFTRQR